MRRAAPTRIALVGAESTGKSTLALMLTGRLRTHGLLAALVAESGSAAPFPPTALDTDPAAHAYMITAKMAAESAAAVKPNVDVLVSDRSPFDHAAYLAVRFEPLREQDLALIAAARAWLANYDFVFHLRTAGSTYVEDGHRQAAEANDYRDKVDAFLTEALPSAIEVKGTFRERSEYVYHHLMAHMLGQTRPKRAYEQLRLWLAQRGWRVLHVRPQGSNSVSRFHPASDHDDVDALVVVDGDADYAIQVRADVERHREHIENIIQANLDALVTPRGLEAYET